jgi:branched-subunit amino acid ABC-type transport system permease component
MSDARIVVVNGALFGVIYGLFAIGLVIVYRGSRVINFAHGEIGMVGAFLFDELWRDHGIALGLAIVAGIGFSALVAGMTDRYFISPLRSQPKVNSMVVTIALSGLLLFAAGPTHPGADARRVPRCRAVARAALRVHALRA